MARRYGRIDEWEKWIPDIDQERELFQNDPSEAVSMELRFLSKTERDQYERARVAALTTGALDKNARDKYMRALLSDHVRNVKNYEYDGEPVTTGEALWDCDEVDLCVAVTGALLRRSSLEEGLAKKLSLASGLKSSPRIANGSGDAAGATPPSPLIIQGGPTKEEISDFRTELSGTSEDATPRPIASPMTGSQR